ncbi:hypothetical protein [Mycolicibacillus trivialis]|uniref:Uncharacterized protein n=1 Tax=Mycolicibacillus trivialis TaxID=1798 RepID=A0A1X2EJK7_9MYCO|nr:hypothetical protein [Mycolicibacillus trivialis]ORX03613.1 hypothetical protein AWC30_10575 [Mycolicibacillus trivialis]
MWDFWVLLLIIATIAVVAAPWLIKRRPSADAVEGTLLITGVSPRPDVPGEQYVTVTGVINGPTLNEHVVYQRMAVDVEDWPKMGELRPVLYSPRNPDKWHFVVAGTDD